MCQGDIHSVKTIVQLRINPSSKKELIFSNHFLSLPTPQKGYLPYALKILQNLQPLLSPACVYLEESSAIYTKQKSLLPDKMSQEKNYLKLDS